MNIPRIKAPKFKVGRRVLNEYEARNLQLMVAKGQIPHGIRIKQVGTCEEAIIGEDGVLSHSLSGFALASSFTLALIRHKKECGLHHLKFKNQ